jgi:hypothetical protein
VAGAGVDQVLEPGPDLLQFRDAPVDVGELRLGGPLDAGYAALRAQGQQLTDLGQREPERFRAANEQQPLDLGLAVGR